MTDIAPGAEARAAVAAIVVTYHTGPILERCLDALERDPAVDEVVVVDNGNPPDVRAALARRAARWIDAGGNTGFAAAANRGAAATACEVLVFVNPDAVAADGAVRQLVATVLAAPANALVGGRVMGEDGREQRGDRREEVTLWRAFVAFSGLARLERAIPAFRDLHRHRDPPPPGPAPVPVISGAFFGMRRAAFVALGGFDDGYFLHVEDIDLCRRVRAAGGTVLFEPRAQVVHAGATSAVSSRFVAKHKAAGFARYFAKFARGPGERLLARALAPALRTLLVARSTTTPPLRESGRG